MKKLIAIILMASMLFTTALPCYATEGDNEGATDIEKFIELFFTRLALLSEISGIDAFDMYEPLRVGDTVSLSASGVYLFATIKEDNTIKYLDFIQEEPANIDAVVNVLLAGMSSLTATTVADAINIRLDGGDYWASLEKKLLDMLSSENVAIGNYIGGFTKGSELFLEYNWK